MPFTVQRAPSARGQAARRAHRPILLLALAGCACAADFSGAWLLDAQRSDLHSVSLPAAQRLTVSQQQAAIQCEASYADGSARRWSYLLDGAETRVSLGDSTESSIVKWEGAALLVNTQVSGARDYTVMDRWDLARDGATLTITRQVALREGLLEATLVYRKQPPLAGAEPVAEPPGDPANLPAAGLVKQPPPPAPADFVVARGTHIGLELRNALDTKHAKEGDHVYLETIEPITARGRIVIPRGSYVNGTVTESKPAKGIKSKGEMYIRFDSLVLPNGVTRDFRSRLVSADGAARGTVDAKEGKITGERDSSGDARTVAEGAGIGASVGTIAGAASGHTLPGLGIGAAAGAGVALATIFHGKKPEAVLPRGTIVEMVLDRDLIYGPNELPF